MESSLLGCSSAVVCVRLSGARPKIVSDGWEFVWIDPLRRPRVYMIFLNDPGLTNTAISDVRFSTIETAVWGSWRLYVHRGTTLLTMTKASSRGIARTNNVVLPQGRNPETNS